MKHPDEMTDTEVFLALLRLDAREGFEPRRNVSENNDGPGHFFKMESDREYLKRRLGYDEGT